MNVFAKTKVFNVFIYNKMLYLLLQLGGFMATFAVDGALIVVCSVIMYFVIPFNGKSVKKILCCLVAVLHWQCCVSDN